MSATKVFRRLRDLKDVTFGTPANRDALLYNSSTGKSVMREIVSADISDATEVNLANTIVRRDAFGYIQVGSISAGNITSTEGVFSGDGSGLTALNADEISTGTLAQMRGGTGFGTYTTGDILYASDTDTLSKLAANATADLYVLGMTSSVPSWSLVSTTNVAESIVRRDASSLFYTTTIKGQFTGVTDASLNLEGGTGESGEGAALRILGGSASGEGTLSGGAVEIYAGEGRNQSAPMTNGQARIVVYPATGGDDGGGPFTTGGSILLIPGAGAGSGSGGDVVISGGNLSLTAGNITASGTVTATSFVGSGTSLTGVALRASTNTFTAQNTFAAGTITTSQPFTITQTWTQSGITYNAFLVNVTNTNSDAASLLANLQVGGTSKFKVDKNGAGSFISKTTTTTGSSLVVGEDIGPATNTGRAKLTLGSSTSNSEFIVGQASNRGLLFNWTYSGTAASAFGTLETYGNGNALYIRGFPLYINNTVNFSGSTPSVSIAGGTHTQASAITGVGVSINPTFSQTGTASAQALLINPVMTAVGSGSSTAALWIEPTGTVAAATRAIVIKMAATPTANPITLLDSTGAVVTYLGSNGFINTNQQIYAASNITTATGYLIASLVYMSGKTTTTLLGSGGNWLNVGDTSGSNNIGVRARNLYLQNTTATVNTTKAKAIFEIGVADEIGLIIKGFTSQTGNLTECQNVSGNILRAVTSAASESLASGVEINWSTSATDATTTKDVGLKRSGTNELTVSNGSTGRGNIYCNFLKTDQVAVGAAASGLAKGYVGIKDASGNSVWVPYWDNGDMIF